MLYVTQRADGVIEIREDAETVLPASSTEVSRADYDGLLNGTKTYVPTVIA
jgi:hypothetical protein